MKNILFVASEGVPFIKTGGLADVVGSLPKCVDKRYFDIRVMIPKYTCIPQDLRDSAGITKEVVIIGDGEKAEVWDRAKWDELQKQDIFDKENIRDMLESMDIDF